jgi:hypothetical protein
MMEMPMERAPAKGGAAGVPETARPSKQGQELLEHEFTFY